jgi:hypothetical protein
VTRRLVTCLIVLAPSLAFAEEPSDGAASAEAKSAEVESAEVESAEVESAEVESAEVESAEVESAEVESAEVESAEVESDVTNNAVEFDPDAGVARPESADLRTGHVFVRAAGGLLLPSSPFIPAFDVLSSLDAGGGFHGQVGVGLGRYLVLQGGAGFALFPASSPTCDGCGATSIDAGADLQFHVNQGFALDPWVSYGMGYRHTIVAVASLRDDVTVSAFEFMRLGFGADYYPTAAFGFGPYMQVDVGVRDFDNPAYYGLFQTGLRLTFDPVAIGTAFAPGDQTARR